MLTVNVPDDAKVFVNGAATRSTGSLRQYISRGLDSDRSYTYEVRAEVTRNGKTIEQTKSVRLEGGQTVSLAFDLRSSDTPATTLTLNVPEDAKVILGGKETSATGDVRTYRTTKLEAGKSWSDYKVVVSVDRDGETLTKEETIKLSAGDDVQLSFNFDTADPTKVASTR